MSSRSAATACANIALVKYWGKRDEALNAPARGSLSVTLEALRTTTEVEIGSFQADELILDGEKQEGRPLARVTRFLDFVRTLARSSARARVTSANTFPTAAGLASSASGFAALALASTRAFGVVLQPHALSAVARRGSGSAARSMFGGFVRMQAGTAPDAHDAYAEPIEGAKLELAAAIAVARASPKTVGSTEGMERTRQTSPFHDAWLLQVDRDLAAAEEAIDAGVFEALGEIAEGSCLAMHANAMAARPGILYFASPTLWAIERVRALRREGVPVFFTVDAGPHVVAFTIPSALDRVAAALREHPEVKEVITSRMGPGAELVQAPATAAAGAAGVAG